jgi:hypothetical protein
MKYDWGLSIYDRGPVYHHRGLMIDYWRSVKEYCRTVENNIRSVENFRWWMVNYGRTLNGDVFFGTLYVLGFLMFYGGFLRMFLIK